MNWSAVWKIAGYILNVVVAPLVTHIVTKHLGPEAGAGVAVVIGGAGSRILHKADPPK